jgi:hypothetical protein
LVQLGEPDIEEIIPEHPTVSVLVRGQLIVTRFDAPVRKPNGRHFLQEVKPEALLLEVPVKESIVRQICAQTIFAKQTGATYQLRTEKDIYRYPMLVDNKQRMRQILALHREENLEVEIEYLSSFLLRKLNFKIEELGQKNHRGAIGLQRLEAAAYRLYAKGILSINLKEARYGSSNSVASYF